MEPVFERALALRNSNNPIEKQSLFLGTHVANGSPLLVHLKSLSEHLYIRGTPGSGKSAALAFLVELLISLGKCILHLFDLKDQNSMELFSTIREGAARSGTRVKWFVDRNGKSTFTYNLFLQSFWYLLTPLQKAALVGAALGSTNGLEGYGPQWFGGAAFEVLVTVFERYEIVSWRDLWEKLKLVLASPRAYGLDKMTVQAGTEVKNSVARLARVPALNTPFSSIDLCSAEPCAVYWSFPGAYELTGVVSRLALYSLFAAADNTTPGLQTWAVLDEFSRAIGNRVDLLFQQAREKLGLIVANQCLADLRTRDKDYAPTIKTCCRLHWTFNAADEDEQRFMSEASGEVVRNRKTTSYKVGEFGLVTGESRSYAETTAKRYGVNDISIASAHPKLSIFRCTQDHGFMQFGGFPQIVHTDFHIDAEEYERRKHMPWPGPEDGTITGEMPPPIPPPQPPGPKPVTAPNIVNPDRKPPRRKH